RAQRDYPGAHQWSNFAEEVEINFQFNRIERNVHNLQTTHPGWTVDTVAGMTPERLRDAHYDITGFCQRCIDRQIAEHACYQSVVSIAGAQRLFQEFDTQRFDLIDMPGASEPAVHRANMPLGSAGAYLSREEVSDRWTG